MRKKDGNSGVGGGGGGLTCCSTTAPLHWELMPAQAVLHQVTLRLAKQLNNRVGTYVLQHHRAVALGVDAGEAHARHEHLGAAPKGDDLIHQLVAIQVANACPGGGAWIVSNVRVYDGL